MHGLPRGYPVLKVEDYQSKSGTSHTIIQEKAADKCCKASTNSAVFIHGSGMRTAYILW